VIASPIASPAGQATVIRHHDIKIMQSFVRIDRAHAAAVSAATARSAARRRGRGSASAAPRPLGADAVP
jgi:hypothetical protein